MDGHMETGVVREITGANQMKPGDIPYTAGNPVNVWKASDPAQGSPEFFFWLGHGSYP